MKRIAVCNAYVDGLAENCKWEILITSVVLRKTNKPSLNNVSGVQASTIFPLFTFITQQNFGASFSPSSSLTFSLLVFYCPVGECCAHTLAQRSKQVVFSRLELWGEPHTLHAGRVRAGWIPCCAPCGGWGVCGNSFILPVRQRWLENPIIWAVQKCNLKWCRLLWFPAAQQGVFYSQALSSLLCFPTVAWAQYLLHHLWAMKGPVKGHVCSPSSALSLKGFPRGDPDSNGGVILHFVAPLLEIPLSTLGIHLLRASSVEPLVLLQHSLV